MEAKTGRGKQGFSRRKSDALSRPGIARNLDWGTEPSDIPLHLQSPLTISKALITAGSKITLLQSPASGASETGHESLTGDTRGNITPIHSRKPKKPANSAGLLTQLDNTELRNRCKRLIVENALVKNKNEKQLYLAVGFLEWTDSSDHYVKHYSPLLFYPVRLINESTNSSERFGHVIYNDDGIPHNNEHLREELLNKTAISLPEFDSQYDLEHYFNSVSSALSGHEKTFRLDMRMGLGIAVSPAGVNPSYLINAHFGRLPKDFSRPLARSLLANQDMGTLRVTLNLLGASNDYLHDESSAGVEAESIDLVHIREFSTLLTQQGLGNVEFNRLGELPDQINQWVLDIKPAIKSKLICKMLKQSNIQALSLMKLAGIIELIDKAPENIDKYLHKDLAYRGTPLLFKRARHQALMIEEELAQLQQHFHLDRLPAKSQLLLLIEELGGAQHGEIEVVDSHYFNARRQFMDFSTDKPTTLSQEHKRLLNKLVKVLRFRELFVNNTEYRLALGPAYRGLKTKWSELEGVLDYAQELRQVLDSESMAAMALSNWRKFRKKYTESLDVLQSASTGMRGLLQVVKPYDRSTSAEEILEKAIRLSGQLREWNTRFGRVNDYGNKTANNMLHVLAQIQGLDHNNDENVRHARDIIREYLAEHSDATDHVEPTLMWLLTAIDSDSASLESIMDIIGKTG